MDLSSLLGDAAVLGRRGLLLAVLVLGGGRFRAVGASDRVCDDVALRSLQLFASSFLVLMVVMMVTVAALASFLEKFGFRPFNTRN